MGWFGFVNNEKSCKDHERAYNEILDEVSEDTMIWIVDCHI